MTAPRFTHPEWMTTLTALPTVRGDLLLLTGGRTGAEEDTYTAAAAVLVDAALAGAIDLSGRRLFGVDRRRIIVGPIVPADPLLADVRERVAVATPDNPWSWCQRAAVFAEEAIRDELVATGAADLLHPSLQHRLTRHRRLEAVDTREASARVDAAMAGTGAGADVALALLLREASALDKLLGKPARPRTVRNLECSAQTLPPAASAVLEAVRAWRKRADRICTWYADD